MDRKKTKQIQNARIVATNIFMGLSVVAIVFVLMLVAMGFTFNESGNLEQSGLVQISSNPSSATVEIDGNTQFGRTQISKMLSTSEHDIKVTKAGYDTWEKKLKVDAGLLTRIEWVRLFPLKPEKTEITSFGEPRMVAVSSDRKRMLYAEKDESTIINIDLQGEKAKRTKLSLATILGVSKGESLNGTLSVVAWNSSNNKIILNWTTEEKSNWYLVDLETVENTINLTEKFSLKFTNILIANDSASKLWALEDGNLHLIDASNLTISAAKIANIERIANNKDIVIYLSTDKDDKKRSIKLYKDGESGSSTIAEVESTSAAITLAMGTYWGDDWIAYSIDNKVTILSGTPPSADKPRNNALKTLLTRELEYTPQHISVNDNQRLVVFAADHNLMSYDIETRSYYDSAFESTLTSVNWLDDYLLWQHHENKIIIQDFDGDNRRELLKKVNTQLPIALSENNKWLYFFELTEEVDEEKTDASTETTDAGSVEANTETKFVYTLKREKLQI
mgnify:CR=1 FL=1